MSIKGLLSGIFLGMLAGADASEQRFAFAVPEMEGGISLGVFDNAGKLVRTLSSNAAESDFTVGLNGLIATWDGRNEAGEAQPAGKYFVRGFVLGAGVASEGEAFHFNDWVDSEESARASILQVAWAAGDDVFLSGVRQADDGLTDGVLCSYREAEGLKEVGVVPHKSQLRGASAGYAFFNDTNGMALLAVPYDKSLSPIVLAQAGVFDGAAFWKERLYLARAFEAERFLRVFRFGNPPLAEGEVNSPWNLRLLDANEAGVAASDGRKVWVYRGGDFEEVPLGEEVEVVSLSAGHGATFWILGRISVAGLKGDFFVRQYSFRGEVLRQLTQGITGGRVFADKGLERIFLMNPLEDSSGVAIRGLRPVAGGVSFGAGDQKTADWEIFLDKTAIPCGKFGLVDGKLVPDAGGVVQNESVSFHMAPSPLSSKPKALKVGATVVNGEIWLKTAGGLRLMKVGELPGARRCVVQKDGGNLRVYAGSEVVVAEYLVTGLKEIVEIEAGEIDLP